MNDLTWVDAVTWGLLVANIVCWVLVLRKTRGRR